MEHRTWPTARRLRQVLLPVMALLVALAVTVSAGMCSNADTLDRLFGRGARTVTAVSDAEQLDTAYYEQRYANKKEALAAATTLSRQISDEGIVLLKNDGLLPLSEDTVISPFGLRYVLPFYGGTGSSAIDSGEDRVSTPSDGLSAAFAQINPVLEGRYAQALGAGASLAENGQITACRPTAAAMEGQALYEFAPSVYQGTEDSCAGTVGIVFIGRQAGENQDASTSVYNDGTPHMLAPTAAELDTVAYAKRSCDAVVVVLATASPMEAAALEDDPGVSAILWLGGAGSTGFLSLGDILTGRVTPSGRLPDTWAADFKSDPTFPNQDDGSDCFVYDNAYTTLVSSDGWQDMARTPFREYEEGVYLGYRYYETAFEEGALTDYHNRTDGVLYPFGYGLSYASFRQEIRSFAAVGDEIRLTVRVTNTGARHAGKDVVQIYFSAPYTGLDRELGVEKPAAVLVRFGKTGMLAPGEYEDVPLRFDMEDMASYCSARDNGDGTAGCYMLEAGAYTVSLRTDSHTVLDTREVVVPATAWYDGRNPRRGEQAAVNRFPQIDAYMADPLVSGAVILSRSDWLGTQPTAPTEQDRNASDTVAEWIAQADSTKFDCQTDPLLGNVPGSAVYQTTAPVTGEDSGLVLANLRGKSYHDPMWNDLLNQLTFADAEELRLALFEDAYKTGAVDAIGKPASLERDGPQGLTFPDQSGKNWISGVCGYPASPVLAAAWNLDLAYAFGEMVGQEAMLCGINGWYAPGLNLRRSPFNGRCSEYFSEDPLLAGLLGAQVVSGAGDAGLSCAVKHLGPMDTEAHRNPHTTIWLTEQALREIYLRPFELTLKNAEKTVAYVDTEGTLSRRVMKAGDFIMAADCAIGSEWAAANYALLTQVVRGEWGFEGFILSDIHLNGNANQLDKMLRAGCDALLNTSYGVKLTPTDIESPTANYLLRRSIKNVSYTLVNSNLMQGAAPGSRIHYSPAPWLVWLTAADVLIGLAVAVMAILVAVYSRREDVQS